eukprot:gene9627-10642_t
MTWWRLYPFTFLLLVLIRAYIPPSSTFCKSFAKPSNRLCGSRLQSTASGNPQPRTGYVPPELDPEYKEGSGLRTRRVAYHPLQSLPQRGETAAPTAFLTLPVPKEGDVVRYQDSFRTNRIGRIRFLQYREKDDTFYADIVPLMPGKTDGIFRTDRQARADYKAIAALQPVKAFYVRSEDGYKVYRSNSTSEVVLRAEKYRPVDKTFVPRKKEVNFAKLNNDLKDYEKLKSRINLSALKVGAGVGALVAAVCGVETIFPYSLGVTGSLAYFALLSKQVEAIGGKYSALPLNSTMPLTAPAMQSSWSEKLSKLRFTVPVMVLGILLAKVRYFDDYHSSPLHLLPQKDFLAAMGGFLTLRLTLFLSEVAKEFRLGDILEVLPGSTAIVLKRLLLIREEENQGAVSMPRRVVFVTGPVVAGRYEVMERVLSSQNSTSPAQCIPLKVYTTDPAYSTTTFDNMNTWVQHLSEEAFIEKQRRGEFLFTASDRDKLGRRLSIGVATDQLSAYSYPDQKAYRQRREKDAAQITVLMGPPSLLDALLNLKTISLTAVWISMQNKEQFVNQAKAIVLQQLNLGESYLVQDSDVLAKSSAEQVSDLVNEAAQDITYYMANAPIFDFTIFNSPDDNTTVEEMRQILLNMRI